MSFRTTDLVSRRPTRRSVPHATDRMLGPTATHAVTRATDRTSSITVPTTLIRAAWLLLLVALARPAIAAPANPQLPELSDSDRARLDRGEIVVIEASNDGPQMAGSLTGLMQLGVPPRQVWDAVLDFERVASRQRSLQEVERYRDVQRGNQRQIAVRYHLRVLTTDIRYHIDHRYHADRGLLTWTLDHAEDNDLHQLEGSFSTWPGARAGETLLLYRSTVDTGRAVPDWVRRRITESALRDFLEAIQHTAEG